MIEVWLNKFRKMRSLHMYKGGIFDAGFGEILRSPHLQWAGKRKFAP